MAGITINDLPPEVRPIVNTGAWDGACDRDQPICSPDPRVTAQLTDDPPIESEKVRPWQIANAAAGDLIMSPGGPSGLIGGLLSKLDPGQYYSHMAIMVTDQIELRQATASEGRIERFYDGSILGIQDAPTNGIKEEGLRHQWPGTLSQSIEKAYLSWRDRPLELDGDGNPKKDDHDIEIPAAGFGYKDEVSGSSFIIDAVSFSPVPMTVRGIDQLLWPLVVTSCTELTTTTVLNTRRRVADVARDLRGHYRLFGYTNGAIAMDPAVDGPSSFEAEQRDPACSGSIGSVPVDRTRAMVCSTFPWAAVRRANELAANANPPLPRIILDGRPQHPHRADASSERCAESAFFKRLPDVDRMDAQTPDGLYFYGEGERKTAALWLHDDYMIPKVEKKIDASLPDVWGDLGVAGGLGVSALIALLTALPLTTVAIVLGLAPAIVDELVILTSDMPDDVANQLCNAFASDDCTEESTDSEAWKSPGVGRSVSPDNIINAWAPPTSESPEFIHGLYGWNDRIRIRPPAFVENPPPRSTWQISQGVGSIEGRIVYRDHGGQIVGVAGAHIRIGCSHFASQHDGLMFESGLPSGRYWCTARYTDLSNGLIMDSKGQEVTIPDGAGVGLHIELMPPPDSRREILVTGHMDLVNRYAVGKDWWGHPAFARGPTYLGLDYWPPDPQYQAQREASIKQKVGTSQQVDDWGQAELACDLEIQADRSVKVSWRARLKNDDGDPWQKTGEVIVPPKTLPSDPPVRAVIDIVRSEMAWPVRAHIEFGVDNATAP
jgi:hypothetical protein